MANRIEFKLTGDWKKMAAAMDPKRFKANLDNVMGNATKLNGMMVAGEVRKRIKAKKYAKNAPLTVLIKKSSTPLVNDGDLFGAITSQNIDKYTVFIGILRSATTSDGYPLTNLAELLHNGGHITVTEHMRNMFILLAEVGQGKREASSLEGRAAELARALGSRIRQIKPLKSSTKYITIPPRPFLLSVLNDPTIHARCKKNWQRAAQIVMKDQASGSPSKGGSPSSLSRSSVPRSHGGGGGKVPKVRNRSEAARKGWRTRRARQGKAQG